MNDQQLGETPCTVDLSASTLPEQATAEMFTTTIDNNKPDSGFDGFGFSEELLKTLAAKGYIQAQEDREDFIIATGAGATKFNKWMKKAGLRFNKQTGRWSRGDF